MTDAEILEQLTALKRARNSGVLTVKHGDTTTVFRSLSEIERIINELENALNPERSRVHYVTQRTRAL